MTMARTLFANLVDYAGLFPPAKLEMSAAVDEYLHHRQLAEAWMLGPFVLATKTLPAFLEELAKQATLPDVPLRISLLFNLEEDFAKLALDWVQQWQQAVAWINESGLRISIDQIELKSPWPIVSQPELINTFLGFEQALRGSQSSSQKRPEVFVESAGSADAINHLLQLLRIVHDQTQAKHAYGFKYRTGSLRAEKIPSIETLANVIVACKQADVRWKATAGLHHVCRNRDAKLDLTNHGFLSLLCAVALAEQGAPAESLHEILAETDPGKFALAHDGIHYAGKLIPRESLTSARQRFCSFGSCSFAEPVADLLELGWLE